MLLRCDAIPEPTFLWWDARLQPRFGTVEVRIMDAQTRVRDTAALAALVQCLVRREALDDGAAGTLPRAPEVLEENRFLAARDGVRAELVVPALGCRVPVGELLPAVLARLRARGARARLRGASWRRSPRCAAATGESRQRVVARARGLLGVLRALHMDFASPQPATVA